MRLVGDSESNTLIGDMGNNALFGLAGNDTLIGNEGDDYIVGGTGSDRLEGGAGNDFIFSSDAFLVVQEAYEYGMTDTYFADTALGGDGDDIIFSVGSVDGGPGNDTILGGNALRQGGDGDDVFLGNGTGGPGSDTFIFEKASMMLQVEDPDGDRFVINGNFAGNVYLGILSSADIVEFRNITAIQGIADVAARTVTTPFITSIRVDEDTEVYFHSVTPGAGGQPSFRFNETDVEGLIASINQRVAHLMLNGTPFTNGPDSFVGTAANETLYAADGNDTVDGAAGNDLIDGGRGNDSLFGGAGNDTLAGGGGTDTLDGGTDFDIADYGALTGPIAGNLMIDVAVKADGTVDTLRNIEGLIGGSGSDFLVGNDAGNRLQGGAGNDNLWGYGGNDILIGDLGDDIIVGGLGNDTLVGGDGQDWLYGQEGDDSITGVTTNSAGSFNVLVGGEGADTLEGGEFGFDYFYDGEGTTDSSHDIIVVRSTPGIKVLNSFEVGGTNDAVRLIGTSLTSFAQVQENLSFSPVINGTVLVVGSNTQVWFLSGVQPGQLTAADFQFA